MRPRASTERPQQSGGHAVRVACSEQLASIDSGSMETQAFPKDSILVYEAAIKSDKFLVVAHGAPDDVRKAKEILDGTSPERTDVYIADAD